MVDENDVIPGPLNGRGSNINRVNAHRALTHI